LLGLSRFPRSLPALAGVHLLVTAAVASGFAWHFEQSARVIAAHVLLVAQWDLALAAVSGVLVPFRSSRAWRGRVVFKGLLALTGTLQVYLYALDAVSNSAWGRNITGHLVVAFAPTVWSGREPFPLGATGLTVAAVGTLVMVSAAIWWWGPSEGDRLEAPATHPAVQRLRAVAAVAGSVVLLAVTLHWAVADRDNLLWKDEPIAGFFRPDGYAFEPTARRSAVEQRDAVLQASYPRRASVLRKNVVLIIVDSLRADHMQVYGYRRPTSPFLSAMVQHGRMKKVEEAFSTCSESFCGITSTLTGREFRDISARTFDLQDVLRDEGYRTWFLLSGNHSGWNGLPQFYHASAGTFFDGTQTQRYTMDDDRLVLEGLERVPAASASQPAFFYIHLMSTHYLGVQFPESHLFTPPDGSASDGLEPYETLVRRVDTPDRYDDKVRQADGMIRAVFEALAAKHYLDDAIVVVTADHGEGLGERHFAHGWNLYNEDIRIPMLVYDAPEPSLLPDLTFATQVDIAPTIVDRLGLPIPASWEGQSLLEPARTRFTYHQTYFLPNRFAVLYRDGASLFKFIATPQYGQEELYDLRRDAGETHNLVDRQPDLAALLRDKVRAYRGDE
jgi:glucan phosphoethanolaminetransferase (alkaline phosphatase superfamily)